MITLRPANQRGHTKISWLDSRHTFSFGQYYDPRNMGFRGLRVINDDRVAPRAGFGTHGHDNMEIITWVLEGVLAHRDSTGGEGKLVPGTTQVMSAGRGIEHSEYNGSDREGVHFLQVWIEPSERDVEPRYADRTFPPEGRTNRWQAIASGPRKDHDAALSVGGNETALPIAADAAVYVAELEKGQSLNHKLVAGRGAWLHVARGEVTINGQRMGTGDGAAIEDEGEIKVTAGSDSELMMFDLV